MIAVTGANGLLGSHIVRKLVDDGHTVVALCRSSSDRTALKDLDNKLQWRFADVTDSLAIEEAFEGITHVIHTAALVSFKPGDRRKMIDHNVAGTQHVVNACVSSGVKRLIHISSIAALGRQKNQFTVDETNKWVESPLNSSYAKSKYAAELEVFRAQEEGLSTVVLNPSVILGPADWNRSSSKLFKYVWDERPYFIDGSLNYVDVRDVANIAVRFLDSPVENERFIINGGSTTYIAFLQEVARRFQKKAPSLKVNRNIIKIVATLEDLRSRITGSDPLITKETARLADVSFFYDNKKISKALNYQFQSIDDTLQWCCEHYLHKINGKI